jgi:hypothetical protein
MRIEDHLLCCLETWLLGDACRLDHASRPSGSAEDRIQSGPTALCRYRSPRVAAPTIPVQPKLLPERLWSHYDRFQSGQALADDTRTASRLCAAFWRRLMEHRIQPTSGDEGHLLRIRMETPFKHTVGSLAHALERAVGKPSPDHTDHLVCPHPHGRVPCAQPFTDFRSRRQYTEERPCPALLRPGKAHDNGHHDPAHAWTTDRLFSTGEGALAILPSCADRAAPPPLQRFIDDQVSPGTCWHTGLNDEQKKRATHGSRRPPRSVEYLVKEAPVARPPVAASATLL